MQPEIHSDDVDEPLNLFVPELTADHPLSQTQEPLHIYPNTFECFIPGQMWVGGNYIEKNNHTVFTQRYLTGT
jgi:hypothetical protein